MKLLNIKRALFYRHLVLKQWDHYSELETNILLAIFLMNEDAKRCSSNTLFCYLSKIRRTPYKKKFLIILKQFKSKELIRVFGKGRTVNMVLTLEGKLHLYDLEKRVKQIY